MKNLPDWAKEIEARLSAATPGPWTMLYTFGSKDLPCSIVHGDKSKTVLDWTEYSSSSCADVELIAHSPTDISRLLTALGTEIEKVRIAAESLEFYRLELSWRYGGRDFCDVEADGGMKAKEALARIEALK